MSKILLLTGPGGAGKSTIAELTAKHQGYIYLDGDNEDTEFFPSGNQWLPENDDLLKKAHEKILRETKVLVEQGNNVVVDYIIFGRYLEFIQSFQREFGDSLTVRILFPSKEELIKRDAERECWTSGIERIKAVYAEFESIQNEVGTENYLDTTLLSKKDTVTAILNSL